MIMRELKAVAKIKKYWHMRNEQKKTFAYLTETVAQI